MFSIDPLCFFFFFNACCCMLCSLSVLSLFSLCSLSVLSLFSLSLSLLCCFSDTLRRAADWEEQRDRETQCVFYYNTTTSESSWSKPDVLRENELKERGWQMVQEQTEEQWGRLLKQSKLVRLFERDEASTGMAYLW
jgi:hypothetical protein